MIREYVKIFLFLSSYSPLFIALTIKNYTNTYFVIIMMMLILFPMTLLLFILSKSSKMSGEYQEIKYVEDKSDQFLEYIVTYIIPFLDFDLGDIPDLIALGVIFLMIGALYIRSDLIYMNPILNFMGYNMYKVKSKSNEFMLISKSEMQRGKHKTYFISKRVGVKIE